MRSALAALCVAALVHGAEAIGVRLSALCDRLPAGQISVSVVDANSARVLFERDAEHRRVPASNVKLLTSFAAFTRLTPQYRFRTLLQADRWDQNRIVGNLYLRGYGDPTLVTETLMLLAKDLRVLGITRVTRDLVIDDSYFDGERFPPGYATEPGASDDDASYRAPTGAVSLNFNTVRVVVRPGEVGKPAVVAVDPRSPYVRLTATVDTVARGASHVQVDARGVDHTVQLTISGQIRAGAEPLEFRRRIVDPDHYAGETLRAALGRYGVQLRGRVRRGTTPISARVIVEHLSDSLGVLILDMNKVSQNFMAEQILKTLGAETFGVPGTTEKGLEAVRQSLEAIGIARSRYTLENGSGLGMAAQLSTADLTALLRAAWRDFRIAPEFVASLAVAGSDGTLARRMVGTAAERLVRAKTGTMVGVTALAGYVAPSAQNALAFAILIEGASAAEAKQTGDAIAAELAVFMGEPAPPVDTAPAR